MWEQGERERRARKRREWFASLHVGQGLLLGEAPLLMIQLAWKPDLGYPGQWALSVPWASVHGHAGVSHMYVEVMELL